MSGGVTMCATLANWRAECLLTGAHIAAWAERVTLVGHEADLSMFSSMLQADVTKQMGMCVPRLFNHQTHHRGQVHAMITAAGYDAPVTNLIFMPEDI